jgi:ribonuclease HI
VKNQDIWMALDTQVSKRTLNWAWVKGHSGHSENEQVDKAANEEAQKAAAKKRVTVSNNRT